MQIWAHTLIKNEARWLWYSVSSVIDFVDRLLLWDTGSDDGSIEIEKALIKKYPEKIVFRSRLQKTEEDFADVRQEMLEATHSDWFLIVDGDEIWWRDSIGRVIEVIKSNTGNAGIESLVVPTKNLVGDIFHHQDESAGKYEFGGMVGHYNLRAIKRTIPGLHSQGRHGVWGWADGDGRQVQDQENYRFVNAPYLHATHLRRSPNDPEVVKREKKFKYELGENFPLDFYYPEVFFEERPDFVESPWKVASYSFKFRAFFETPLKKIKRKIWKGKTGY